MKIMAKRAISILLVLAILSSFVASAGFAYLPLDYAQNSIEAQTKPAETVLMQEAEALPTDFA